MKVKDLLNKNRQSAQVVTNPETILKPVKEEVQKLSFPNVPISPYRQAVTRACELARRLGLMVYEVENKGKIYVYEVLEDKESLLMELDPSDYASLEDFEWNVRDRLGKILVKRGGAP